MKNKLSKLTFRPVRRQFHQRLIRWFKPFVWTLLILFCLFYLLPLTLINLPFVQDKLAKKASSFLEKTLNTEVSLGKVYPASLGRIGISDILIKDRQQQPLIKAERLEGGIDWLELLRTGEISIRSARLFDGNINLYHKKDGKLNADFIIKLIEGDPNKPSKTRIRINTVIIRNTSLSYLPKGKSETYTLNDLNLKVRKLFVRPKDIGGELRHLSFNIEDGAFMLKEMSGAFTLKNDRLKLQDLFIRLPHSNISLPKLSMNLQEKNSGIPSFDLDQLSGTVIPSDLAFLYPKLENFTDICSIELSGYIKKQAVVLNNLYMSYPDLNLTIEGLKSEYIPKSREDLSLLLSKKAIFLDNLRVQVNQSLFSRIAEHFLPTDIRNKIKPLRFVDLKCYVIKRDNGDSYKFYTDLLTSAGKINGDINAAFTSSTLLPDNISGMLNIENNSLLNFTNWSKSTQLSCAVKIDLKHTARSLIKQFPYIGKVDADIRRAKYKDLSISNANINLQANASECRLHLMSKHPSVTCSAIYNTNGGNKKIDYTLSGDNFSLAAFHTLPDWLRKTSISATASGFLDNFTSLDKMNGQISMSRFMINLPEDKLDMAPFDGYMNHEGKGVSIGASSPYLSAQIRGSFPINELADYFISAISRALPEGIFKNKSYHLSEKALFRADVHIDQKLSLMEKYLKLPIQIVSDLDLTSDYHSPSLLHIGIKTDSIRRGALSIQKMQTDLTVNNNKAAVVCTGDISHKDSLTSRDWKIMLTSDPEQQIVGKINLGKRTGGLDNGEIIAKVRYSKRDAGLDEWKINIEQSNFYLNKIDWLLDPATIIIKGDDIEVKSLRLNAPGRGLLVNGKISHNPEDRLNVKLNHIDLLYILSAAGVSFDVLQTELTGDAFVSDPYGEQIMEANVTSEAFKVNGKSVGSIICHGNWEKDTKHIVLTATVTQDSAKYADVSGFIKPVGEDAGLRLNFDAHDLNLDFISYWVDGFCNKFSGNATGLIRLVGPFSCLGLEGDAVARDLQFGIEYTNVVYTINGPAHFTTTSMDFKDLDITDKFGHKAIFNGHVGYKGFDDFTYRLYATNLNNLLIYNTDKRQNDFIYGAAFASGNATLIGSEHKFALKGNLETDPGSNMTLNFMKPTVSSKTGLLKFVQFDSIQIDSTYLNRLAVEEKSMPIKIGLQLKITPTAKVKLVLDDVNSDGISATTEGNLRIDYDSEGETDVYGKLSLLDGTYQFNFQNIIRKNFELQKGSKIIFSGDPMEATMNVKANYKLTTNLADLDDSFTSLAQNTSSVPLHCVLEVNGAIKRPEVGFNIVLPGSDAELQRRVHSFINTEDEMSKQVAYLIMTGRFNSMNNVNFSDNTADIAASAAATNLSDQLSYILSKFGSNFRFGTSIKTPSSQYANTDMELLMSGSLLNNRLKVNGNFGYRENPTLKGTYVGEFDAEYSLNKSGTVILKAYNHYNNMYQYLKQSSSTWGFGIMYKKDFDNIIELFPKPMRKWFRKKEKKSFVPKEVVEDNQREKNRAPVH